MSNNEVQKHENQQLSTTTHWIQCLIKPDTDIFLEIASIERSLTVEKCLSQPLIADIRKQTSDKALLKVVREIVMNTARTFKFSENIDLGQATILASDLLDFFRTDTMEDIIQMLKMARQGELGSGKGRLDHDVVFNIFIPAYLEKKTEAREKLLKKEQELHKKESGGMSEYARQKFEELSQKLSANKTYEPEKPVVNHHLIWINSLKNSVKNLTLEELHIEKEKAVKSGNSIFEEAVIIYETEIEIRKQ